MGESQHGNNMFQCSWAVAWVGVAKRTIFGVGRQLLFLKSVALSPAPPVMLLGCDIYAGGAAANGGRPRRPSREGAGAFPLDLHPALPWPEDSAITRADIHGAAEWEDMGSVLPAPAGRPDLGPALPPLPGTRAPVAANLPGAPGRLIVHT
jgi:hypothetical protein